VGARVRKRLGTPCLSSPKLSEGCSADEKAFSGAILFAPVPPIDRMPIAALRFERSKLTITATLACCKSGRPALFSAGYVRF
jgi:hypothetical protein